VSTRGYLVQILLPVYDTAGAAAAPELFAQTREELTEQCGGLTAYMRAPARGLWKTDEGEIARDDIVIFEVMVDELDRDWWSAYRQRLEARFKQEALVIRSTKIRRL
jgi:hypothetical protein